MKKFTTLLAIIGAVCAIGMIIHAVNWGNTQMENTRRANTQWEMNWMSRR